MRSTKLILQMEPFRVRVPRLLMNARNYLLPAAAAKCIRLLGLSDAADDVANELQELLGKNLGEFMPPTGLRRPWARVLDTGGNHEVRVLLKLV